MKSLMVLGLVSFAASTQAHSTTTRSDDSLTRRGVDLSRYSMPSVSRYTPSEETRTHKAAVALKKRATYLETAVEFVKSVVVPGTEFRVVDDHFTSDKNGISHVNLRQTLHGIDIDNADFKVNIGRDGELFSFGNNFFQGPLPAVKSLSSLDFSGPLVAFHGAVNTLGLSIKTTSDTAPVAKTNKTEQYTIKKASGVATDPEAHLVYLIKTDGSLALTWRVETNTVDNWLLTYIDAQNNKDIHGVVDYVSDFASATMKVFPWKVKDPSDGSRTTVKDPWLLEASPYTWFSTGGENYTTTIGNNAMAGLNPDGGSDWPNQYRPYSPDLNFSYPWSAKSDPVDTANASLTQIFYTVNKYHDLLYTLGFTEPAGNFQYNNSGKGGKQGDYVILDVQDGWVANGAGFTTPPDGLVGQMRVGIFNNSTPSRDSSFDTAVVVHEYTHGLSMRLTGGAANSGCLGSTESRGMGEGWSDFMAYTTHLKSSDTRNTTLYFGHWITNLPQGYRDYPYSTNLTINPMTYKSIDKLQEEHSIGTVWGVMLYELVWNLIDKHGNSARDLPRFDARGVPTDGRYLAMKLIVDSFSLQPCTPEMPQSRDAILDADKALTGGQNQCEIWKAFAKRGLGKKAALDAKTKTRTEDYQVPAGVCQKSS